ncbi:uncharacterized protein LOC141593129 [Silene latifolia]|uniref:uncharacterized protein LOC141593129 n=1 Tax=Silene latifolia TaxID=37657 RepID=UPI003D7808CC
MSALRGLLQRKTLTTAILSSKTLNPTRASPSCFYRGYATQLQCSNEVNGHCVIAKPTWSSYIPLAQAGLLRKNRGYATQSQSSNEVNSDRVISKPTWSDYIFGKKDDSESAAEVPSTNKSVASLEAMGVRVFGLHERVGSANQEISWDNLAGYDHQKREIEDTFLLPLGRPEVYDEIARGTRHKFESNRPRAVLFEGPPGTGKTASARVIANQAGFPLLYLPLDAVVSKWYGESERFLASVFSLANEIPNGAIIFLDEIDSFACARDGDMNEISRRILSVLLREIDGFHQNKKVVVIGATNRKQDLDPALISRFDSLIFFGLPDQQTRQKIAALYAKHLTVSELMEFAWATEGFSGRNIRDVCQLAERRWASKIIRSKAASEVKDEVPLPPLQEYIESAFNRRKCN